MPRGAHKHDKKYEYFGAFAHMRGTRCTPAPDEVVNVGLEKHRNVQKGHSRRHHTGGERLQRARLCWMACGENLILTVTRDATKAALRRLFTPSMRRRC